MKYYVYIIKSEKYPQKKYIGFTRELEKRLQKHNEGGNKYTKTFRPWKVETAIMFETKEKALKFEKYLKSHSGRAFIKRHF